jgi:hypothetical protein
MPNDTVMRIEHPRRSNGIRAYIQFRVTFGRGVYLGKRLTRCQEVFKRLGQAIISFHARI